MLEKRGDEKLGKPIIVLLSVALGVIFIFVVCLLWVASFANPSKIPVNDHKSLVWWSMWTAAILAGTQKAKALPVKGWGNWMPCRRYADSISGGLMWRVPWVCRKQPIISSYGTFVTLGILSWCTANRDWQRGVSGAGSKLPRNPSTQVYACLSQRVSGEMVSWGSFQLSTLPPRLFPRSAPSNEWRLRMDGVRPILDPFDTRITDT